VRCFDYKGEVLWNAESSRLWNRTFEQIRRRLAIPLDLWIEELSKPVRLNHLKETEFQRRGLAHFHVVLRADGPGEPFRPPSSYLTADLLTQVITSVVKDFTITTSRDAVTWGKQFRIADASTLERDDLRIAAYLAKYVTKSTDGSLDFARRFRARDEIFKLGAAPRLQLLALTAWDLTFEPSLAPMNLRAHARAFGVRGQLITKSRHHSTRFQDLREARAAYITGPQSNEPISGTFTYDGRGYDDPPQRRLLNSSTTVSRGAQSKTYQFHRRHWR
jgi:hypothetical protein